ncbi:hypothetical protein MHU86_1225 [Fragilaria crotonensis]|nr:hypothetical protein MHU86_1225 [Fragilaria crotonensis]
MPLLAWSLKQAQSYRQLALDGKDSALVKFFIRYQAALYFPILLLARLSWLNESFKIAYRLGAVTENAALEMKIKGLQYPVLEDRYRPSLSLGLCGLLRFRSLFFPPRVHPLHGYDLLVRSVPRNRLWPWSQRYGDVRCRHPP